MAGASVLGLILLDHPMDVLSGKNTRISMGKKNIETSDDNSIRQTTDSFEWGIEAEMMLKS